MVNNVEFRPDCNVIISRCDAYQFLSDSKSELETITAKYYEIIANTYKSTGYTADITIANIFDRISDTFGEPCAIIGSITGSNANNSNTPAVDTDTIAGEITSTSAEGKEPSSNIDVVGLAVFKEDVLVRRAFFY